ncbi:MAG: alanine racemase [Methylobacterium radiotolerans]
MPVLNDLSQLGGWQGLARRRARRLPAILQVDTGMARFGLAPDEGRRAPRPAGRPRRASTCGW